MTSPLGLSLWLMLLALVAGWAAGRAKKGRWSLLVGGVAAIVVVSLLSALAAQRVDAAAPAEVMAEQLAGVYEVAVPVLVAYLAGWLCGRARWGWRLAVITVAVVVLAALPYPELGRITAALVAP